MSSNKHKEFCIWLQGFLKVKSDTPDTIKYTITSDQSLTRNEVNLIINELRQVLAPEPESPKPGINCDYDHTNGHSDRSIKDVTSVAESLKWSGYRSNFPD